MAANLTNPNFEEIPEHICFKIDLRYIPEGEEDLVRIEILLNSQRNVFMFLWKCYEKKHQTLFIRYKKVTWKLIVHHGSIFQFDFCTSNNNLTCSESVLEKIVGWPEQRKNFQYVLSLGSMSKVAHYTIHPNKRNGVFLKWFSKASKDYLDEMNINVEKPLDFGLTLLHFAAKMANTAYLAALLPKFETVDVFDSENRTPLHLACEVGNYKAMKLLLKTNANANIKTNKGLTSLMLIAKRKVQDTKMVKLLLKYHASCDLHTPDGMRAIDYARQVSKTSPLIPLLHSVTKV